MNRWLGTPKLVRDTSRRWFWQRGASAGRSSDEVKKDFSDIVLPGQMHDHVRALAAVTSNTKSHGAPFRHMLFYGYFRSPSCVAGPIALVGGSCTQLAWLLPPLLSLIQSMLPLRYSHSDRVKHRGTVPSQSMCRRICSISRGQTVNCRVNTDIHLSILKMLLALVLHIAECKGT